MIQVLVDSASSITPDVARELGLHLIPMKVSFGEETFLDGVTLDATGFYQRLREQRALPITSQPSAGEFLEVFQRLTADGSEVLCVLISHQLSGTLSSAEAARDMLPDRSIHIFNSLSVSIGQALMALAAVDMASANQPIEAILAQLERMRAQMRVFFVVDTLEFLQRGGRIGGATALLGTMLSIKPLLHLANGRIEPLEKVRTKQKAVERMLDLMEQQAGRDTPLWCGVAHADAPDEAARLEREVRSRFN
ncbi:MAG: DegV family protein, partial [Anaerolineae bacterium]|nr:DegV family protein [Anaerolineae bacterium]